MTSHRLDDAIRRVQGCTARTRHPRRAWRSSPGHMAIRDADANRHQRTGDRGPPVHPGPSPIVVQLNWATRKIFAVTDRPDRSGRVDRLLPKQRPTRTEGRGGRLRFRRGRKEASARPFAVSESWAPSPPSAESSSYSCRKLPLPARRPYNSASFFDLLPGNAGPSGEEILPFANGPCLRE